MKKLTLNQAWNRCLAMWKWIDKQVQKGTDLGVEELKAQWIKTQQGKYVINDLNGNCFFCEYASQQSELYDCGPCPGRLADKRFSCTEPSYNYEYKPRKFYKKLLKLDKKRKKL